MHVITDAWHFDIWHGNDIKENCFEKNQQSFFYWKYELRADFLLARYQPSSARTAYVPDRFSEEFGLLFEKMGRNTYAVLAELGWYTINSVLKNQISGPKI